MTADQRLDQLEPLLAQSLATLDRHTAQNKFIISALEHHSDQIGFLLGKTAELATDVAGLKTDVAGLKTDLAGLRTDVTGLRTDVTGIRTDVTGISTKVDGMDGKLERVLDLLENRNR